MAVLTAAHAWLGAAARGAAVVALALGTSPGAWSASAEVEAYRAQLERATREYRLDGERCRALPRAERDLCTTQARAALARERALARAAFKNTPRARMQARVAIAEADHAVALARCRRADARSMCEAEARVALAREVERAKLDLAYGMEPGGPAVDAEAPTSTQSGRAIGTHECADLLDIDERYLCIREAEAAGRM